MRIDVRFAEISYEGMMLQRYLELVEAQTATICEKEIERVRQQFDLEDEAEFHTADHFVDRLRDGVTTRFLTAASLIAFWAHYEASVQEIATYIRKERAIGLRMSQIKGDLLERAKVYFEDSLRFKLHEAEDWPRLRELAELRHILAHGNGDIRNLQADKRPRIERWVAETEGVRLIDDQYVVLSVSYVREAGLFIDNLLNNLAFRTREAFP